MSGGLKLFGYWRSSASWRVRWALDYKNIPYTYEAVNLLKTENRSEEHMKRSPSGLLPVLQIDEKPSFLHQSMAILNYLDEAYPQTPRLFPQDALAKAQVIALCEIINADTAPLQKPTVALKHSSDEAARLSWTQHWIREGLASYERASRDGRRNFSWGDALSAADLLLVPQIYNALRYKIDVASEFPALMGIYKRCLDLESCQKSSPEAQSDAVL